MIVDQVEIVFLVLARRGKNSTLERLSLEAGTSYTVVTSYSTLKFLLGNLVYLN